MSLDVGETHANDAPRWFTNPEGVEFGLAPRWYRMGSPPSGSIGNFVGVRGFHPRLMTLDLFEVPLDSRYSKLHHYGLIGYLLLSPLTLYNVLITSVEEP